MSIYRWQQWWYVENVFENSLSLAATHNAQNVWWLQRQSRGAGEKNSQNAINSKSRLGYAHNIKCPTSTCTCKLCPDICEKKIGGGAWFDFCLGGQSLVFPAVYVSHRVHPIEERSARIEYQICYSLCIVNTGNYFLLTTGKDALTGWTVLGLHVGRR